MKLVALTAFLLGLTATPALADCQPGTWTVVSGGPEDQAVRYETAHFAFRWKGEDASQENAVAAGKYLEGVWAYFIDTVRFPEPYCDTAAKHKANINLDPTFGLSGGPTGERDMGMWMGPSALKDRWGLAHEFTHALQASTRSFRDGKYVGWLWESHANWMPHQLPEFRGEVHCSELLVNFPHLYYGSTRDRYCNWQLLEHLKNKYGYHAVNDIWDKALKQGEPGYLDDDPFSVLMRNQNWTIDQLNDEIGEWAMRNVAWDYVDQAGNDQGEVYRTKYGSYDERSGIRPLRVTALDPLDSANGRYAVPSAWAPQRFGYNIVRLIPDAGAKTINVNFRGVVQTQAAGSLVGMAEDPPSIPPPASDWRWGVVVIGGDGEPRYSPLAGGADGQMIVPLKTSDRAVYLVVAGTPSIQHKIQWDQPYYSIYRYPWMVELQGAVPEGLQPGAKPATGGKPHRNGGGWVADAAKVDATAYVGPYARVLGGVVKDQARIEDHALVRGGVVSGRAVIGAMSIIDDGVTVTDEAVVRTTFMGIGAFEKGTVLSGKAQIIGDAEVRGGPKLSKGVYSGFVDEASQNNPKLGSDFIAPPPEVTTSAPYSWRP